MLGAGIGAVAAGGGSWVPLSVGPGGAVSSTKLLGPSVVAGCGGRAVGVGVVCWIIEGALVVFGLRSHGRVDVGSRPAPDELDPVL